MTNEEKAKEIATKWYHDSAPDTAYRAAIQMAQWKDSQYKEEKKELLGLVKMLKINETNQTIIEDLKAMLQ